jgi:hypothetical protein
MGWLFTPEALVFSVLAIGAFVMMGGLSALAEDKRWNHGDCPDCGKPWKCFDMDSQGGRMYKCGGGHYADITVPWVDRPYSQKGGQ